MSRLRERKWSCFEAHDVLDGENGRIIGVIQRVDATAGVRRVRSPRDLWLVWLNDGEQNDGPLPQPLPREEAVALIVATGGVR